MTEFLITKKKLALLLAGILCAITVPLVYLLLTSYQLYKSSYDITTRELTGLQFIERILESYQKLPYATPDQIRTDHFLLAEELLHKNKLQLEKSALVEIQNILNQSSLTNKQILSENYFFPLIRSIANRSHLILDADLDTYYLMDITTSKIPRIIYILSNDSDFTNVYNLTIRIEDEIKEIKYALETSKKHSLTNRNFKDFSKIEKGIVIFENELKNQQNGNKHFDLKRLSDYTFQLSFDSSIILKSLLTERNTKLEADSLFVFRLTILFWISGIIILIYLITQFLSAQSKAINKILKQKRSLDSSTLIIEYNTIGEITYTNSLMSSLSGYTANEMIGKNISFLNSNVHKKEFWLKFWRVTRAGLIWKGEICNRAKDGSIFWTETVVIPDLDKDEKVIGFSAVGVDITEKKADHLMLEHSLKLASIGEIAARVGHEIKNPLAISVGSSNILKKDLLKENFSLEKVLKSIQKIDSANERIKKIVNGLRTYSRADGMELTPLSIKEIIIETIELIEDVYKQEGINFRIHLPDDDIYINGNLGKLQQILMNLISNARDALEDHSEKIITLELIKINGQVTLTVEDNGSGIPDEIKNKIFLPFFTTKAPGKGTGIGLGVVGEFVKLMNGTIEVSSSPTCGTKFTLRFSEHICQKKSA